MNFTKSDRKSQRLRLTAQRARNIMSIKGRRCDGRPSTVSHQIVDRSGSSRAVNWLSGPKKSPAKAQRENKVCNAGSASNVRFPSATPPFIKGVANRISQRRPLLFYQFQQEKSTDRARLHCGGVEKRGEVWYNSRAAVIIFHSMPFYSPALPGTAKHGTLYHNGCAAWYNRY